MSDFVPNNRHLREVLIFFFHSKKTAAEAHRELQKVYGDHHEGTVSNAIDAFEPSTARKTATIRAEARKSDSTT